MSDSTYQPNSAPNPEPERVRSWNTHWILTYLAVRNHAPELARISMPTVPLEVFLDRAPDALERIGNRISETICARTRACPPFAVQMRAPRTEREFLRVFRLNPQISLSYVRALTPVEAPQGTGHDPSRAGPPGGMYVPTHPHEQVTALDVLCTFSDEPDWGMDQDLFSVPDYGYGDPPFGAAMGPSSQAPFHLMFLHEHPLMVRLAPGIRGCLLDIRVKTFFALAALAFREDVPYWGWRFTAWAMHYLQDVTQPYHAKPLPLPIPWMLGRLASSRSTSRGVGVITKALKTHHLLFEALIHRMLNHLVKNPVSHPFVEALAGSEDLRELESDDLISRCSRIPSAHAKKIDRFVQRFFPGVGHGESDSETPERAVRNMDVLASTLLSPRTHACSEFIGIVRQCLQFAGVVSRYAVLRASSPLGAVK